MVGYEGNGITCTDVDECVGENSCDARAERGFCVNTERSYTCDCYSGYTITSSNICNDVNECEDSSKTISVLDVSISYTVNARSTPKPVCSFKQV